MEQTNLIVTPDGKSWDEVTRDTSYLSSNIKIQLTRDGGDITSGQWYTFDYCRGQTTTWPGSVQKDFAFAYNRLYCLVDGWYTVYMNTTTRDNNIKGWFQLLHNSSDVKAWGPIAGHSDAGERAHGHLEAELYIKRGDWITINCDDIEGAYTGNTRLVVKKL